MSFLKGKYKVSLSCTDHDWWRFNVFMIVVGYDDAGEKVSFDDYTERIYDLEYGTGAVRTAPEGYVDNRVSTLSSGECAYAEIYAYAVANTLPASEMIKDTPAFPARLTVEAGGKTVLDRDYTVNPWGGLTIVALRADAREGQE